MVPIFDENNIPENKSKQNAMIHILHHTQLLTDNTLVGGNTRGHTGCHGTLSGNPALTFSAQKNNFILILQVTQVLHVCKAFK